MAVVPNNPGVTSVLQAASGTPSGANSGSNPLAVAGAEAALPTNNTIAGPFQTTQGWYITAGIVVSVALANTKAGPFFLGILSIALLYQINLLLQHK